MRLAFGLVGVLVAIGIVALMWSIYHPADTARELPKAQERLKEMGVSNDPGTTKLVPGSSGSEQHIDVKVADPNDGLIQHYKLQANDKIIKIGSERVGETFDAQAATDLLRHPGPRQPIVVRRGGQKIELPSGRVVP